MYVKRRHVNLLLIFHQLPILDLLWSVLFLLAVARSLKANQCQRGLLKSARAMIDIFKGEDSLSTDCLPRNEPLTIQLNPKLVRLRLAHLLVLFVPHDLMNLYLKILLLFL